MGAYILVAGVDPRYLLASVLMTAPGSILMAKLFVPETGEPQTAGHVKLEVTKTDANIVGAAARGTSEGLSLALNVGAMLISFLALIALLNAILGLFGLKLETLLGYAFAPVALMMGVTPADAQAVGSLLGTRMVTNEFIAYSNLGPLKGYQGQVIVPSDKPNISLRVGSVNGTSSSRARATSSTTSTSRVTSRARNVGATTSPFRVSNSRRSSQRFCSSAGVARPISSSARSGLYRMTGRSGRSPLTSTCPTHCAPAVSTMSWVASFAACSARYGSTPFSQRFEPSVRRRRRSDVR